jgi:hypothetical protein
MADFLEYKLLLAKPGVFELTLHQCRLGAKSTKPTTFLIFSLADIDWTKFEVVCNHPSLEQNWTDTSGVHHKTYAPHPPIIKQKDQAGKWLTSGAESYPTELNRLLVTWIVACGKARRGSNQAPDLVAPEQNTASKTIFMKGQPSETVKRRRRSEDKAALGGMRSPHLALARVAGAAHTGSCISRVLQEHVNVRIAEHQGTLPNWETDSILGDPFAESDIQLIRQQILTALGHTSTLASRTCIQATVIDAYVQHSGDPEAHLAGWFVTGAPLGIEKPIVSSGIFPIVEEPLGDDLEDIQQFETGWENYRSAESEPEEVHALLTVMRDNGWIIEVDTEKRCSQSFRRQSPL